VTNGWLICHYALVRFKFMTSCRSHLVVMSVSYRYSMLLTSRKVLVIESQVLENHWNYWRNWRKVASFFIYKPKRVGPRPNFGSLVLRRCWQHSQCAYQSYVWFFAHIAVASTNIHCQNLLCHAGIHWTFIHSAAPKECIARRYAMMSILSSVCESVSQSHAGIVAKRLNKP